MAKMSHDLFSFDVTVDFFILLSKNENIFLDLQKFSEKYRRLLKFHDKRKK